MLPQETIRRKRDRQPLSAEEIAEFVEGVTDGRVSEGQIAAFRSVLQRAGLPTTVRLTRGRDIAAACGQLAANAS